MLEVVTVEHGGAAVPVEAFARNPGRLAEPDPCGALAGWLIATLSQGLSEDAKRSHALPGATAQATIGTARN